jgi:hypothetical protein
MPEANRFDLPNGNHLALVTPNYPDEPFRSGRCICGISLAGRTDGALLAEHTAGCQPVPGPFNTKWSHRECVDKLFKLRQGEVRAARLARTPDPLEWHKGTQREMILFMQKHAPRSVMVNTDYERPRAERYWYALLPEEVT